MAVLQVTTNHDFRPDPLVGISQINFQGLFTATFNQAQFGGAGISDALLVTGGVYGDNHPVLEVYLTPGGSGFSAALWDVTDGGVAVIRFIGTGANETITGTDDANANHEFIGGDGADVLTGGRGEDLFIYAATGDVEAGEKIDGKGDDWDYGRDTISVRATNDFRGTEITDIEWIEIFGAGTVATFFNEQLRVPFADSIDKNTMNIDAQGYEGSVQTLVVEADTDLFVAESDPDGYVSLKYVSFWGWGKEDRIFINGTEEDDFLFGSFEADVIDGGAGKDDLRGVHGTDTLNGGAGRDRLEGGSGKDILTGGTDEDAFVFSKSLKKGKNLEHVTDFESGTDVLRLKAKIFEGIGDNNLSKDEFLAGNNAKKAKDGEDRVIYNETTGTLSFDPDGMGGAKAIKFAVLDGAPHLKADDIVIFG